MKRLLKEKLNKKGFTLAELLIVVAIIAVLVAVSVPVFNSKLERSREAADIANMRAAKAAAVAAYLNEEIAEGTTTVFYDAENGTISSTKPAKGYGQGTATNGKTQYTDYKPEVSAKDKVIKVTITPETDSADVKVVLAWE